MSFIRMMFVWFMVVLSAICSGSKWIDLDRAEQSSTRNAYIASRAIDGDRITGSGTRAIDPSWLRVHFKSSSAVDKVVVKKGYVHIAGCVWTVSVYDGETETVCGTYTDKPKG